MDDILKDKRFAHIANDPQFKKASKSERKVKIDKRFQGLFSDKRFQVNYKVDQRGRPINQSSSENFRKYYDLSSDEEDEGIEEDKLHRTSKSDIKLEKSKSVGKKNSSKIVSARKNIGLSKTISSDSDEDSYSESNSNDGDIKEHATTSNLANIVTKKRKGISDEIRDKLHDLNFDYARGVGTLASDSSSDDVSSSESDAEKDEIEHDWGELDKDAEKTDTATYRLAICNMDWDRIRATDLMVLCSSFVPSGGHIESITIYPSEFGIARMKEEEINGPKELVEEKLETNDDDYDHELNEESKEGSKYHMERLRQYQLNRLKYYYAVVVCDSAETASKIYSECDGLEYENSSTRLDLRFIPDDVEFEEEPKDVCKEIQDMNKYEPKFFVNSALQQGQVSCTWDETDPERENLISKLQKSKKGIDNINDDQLQMFLALSSGEEDEVEEESAMDNQDEVGSDNEDASEQNDDSDSDEDSDTEVNGKNTSKSIEKYRNLLNRIQEDEDKKKNRDVEMEITWGIGFKEKTKSGVDEKLKENETLTPFESMIEKKKEKRKQKRKEKLEKKQKDANNDSDNESNAFSDDELPEDIDLNDPYFKEELDKIDPSRKKGKKKKLLEEEDELDDEERQKQRELELLLIDDEEDASGKAHFSLKKIQENEENQVKKKRKGRKQIKKKKAQDEQIVEDDFEVDLKDERFTAIYTAPEYNIDPSASHYRKTKGMDAFIKEKLNRKYEQDTADEHPIPKKMPKLDMEVSSVVSSIKRKTKGFK